MKVTIEQGEVVKEVDVASLTKEERQQLFNLLSLQSFSDEVFVDFEDRPRFKKIRLSDALLECPKGSWFHVSFATRLEGDLEVAQDYPGFTAQLRTHIASGYCKVCRTQHILKEQSVLLSVTVDGLRYSRGFRYDEVSDD